MKKKHLSFLLAISFLIITFQFSIAYKTGNNKSFENSITGTWVRTHYAGGIYEFTKSKKLLRNNPGMEFKSDGSMINRQNASWCGTPPITYANYNGSWTLHSTDSILHVVYGFWGGKKDIHFKVKSIDSKVLMLETIEQNIIKID